MAGSTRSTSNPVILTGTVDIMSCLWRRFYCGRLSIRTPTEYEGANCPLSGLREKGQHCKAGGRTPLCARARLYPRTAFSRANHRRAKFRLSERWRAFLLSVPPSLQRPRPSFRPCMPSPRERALCERGRVRARACSHSRRFFFRGIKSLGLSECRVHRRRTDGRTTDWTFGGERDFSFQKVIIVRVVGCEREGH